jgi:hypothetical protein
MQLASEYFPAPRSYQQQVLQEMYESPELFNEGLLSFQYPLYVAEDEELDHFIGGLIRSAARAVGGVAKAVGGAVGSVAKTVGKAVNAVDKIIPMSVLTSGLSWTPLGMAYRAGLGAMQAAGDGRNVFQGAIRSLASDPVSRFYIDTGIAAARGENVLKAVQSAAQGQIGDLKKSLQFASMVAPFVPGLGTGVAAALGAANALASGQPITEALIAAARSAVPGGAVAQFAFDTATNLAKGRNIGESLLDSARSRLPGGPVAQAAFDGALALAKGKNIQDAAFAATGRLLPPSPFAADALSFVKKVASGQNIQRAALSTAGNVILNRIEQRIGPIVSGVRGRVPAVPSRVPSASAGQAAFNAALARARGVSLPRGLVMGQMRPIPPGVRGRIPFVPSRVPGSPAAGAAFDAALARARGVGVLRGPVMGQMRPIPTSVRVPIPQAPSGMAASPPPQTSFGYARAGQADLNAALKDARGRALQDATFERMQSAFPNQYPGFSDTDGDAQGLNAGRWAQTDGPVVVFDVYPEYSQLDSQSESHGQL